MVMWKSQKSPGMRKAVICRAPPGAHVARLVAERGEGQAIVGAEPGDGFELRDERAAAAA
jgi:hypothetical protein